jgi:rhodanese-related sulfurtransferase
MRKWLSNLSTNQKLGGIALLLGAIATLAKIGPRRATTLDAKDMLTRIEREEDHVTPEQLAAWIIEGRTDYRLIDIRSPEAYATYHIPGAECLPLSQVADGALRRDEKIILYGDGGIHAAQAWMVLAGMGYKQVYTLREGLDAWKEDVLFPTVPASPTAEQRAAAERAAQVARHFGGEPRVAGAAGVADAPTPTLPTPATPAVTAPTLPTGATATSPATKKREGC